MSNHSLLFLEVVIIAYLTQEEFEDLGFEPVMEFEALSKRAELAINLFIGNYYDYHDFDADFEPRKKAIRLATAYQISYLDSSGIMSAEEKQSMASMTIGRTSVTFQGNASGSNVAKGYNLSQDAFNVLKSAGFGYRGVCYGR